MYGSVGNVTGADTEGKTMMRKLAEAELTTEDLHEAVVLWLEKYGYLDDEVDTVDEVRTCPITTGVLITAWTYE